MLLSRTGLYRLLFRANKFSFLRKYSSQNVLNMSDIGVQTYLKKLMLEHEQLYAKVQRTPEESKRLFEMKPIVNVVERRNNLTDNIETLEKLNKKQIDGDENMKKTIEEATQTYIRRITDVDRELQSVLLEPKLTYGGVLLELTAVADSQESMLFAFDLFEMYEFYAKYKDWKVCIISIEKSDIGRISNASMFIEGVGAPELMKMEAGVHRVLRIPTTDKSGSIHTSTVSVTVLPKPTDIEVNIPDDEISLEIKCPSDQHDDPTDNAVRITHIPTGIVVECEEGRSRINNKDIAIQKLRTLLFEKQRQEQTSKMNSEKKTQIGSNDQTEQIRTYNYAENRVTEHREGGGTIHNVLGFMEGDYLLEKVQDNLLREYTRREFLEEINQLAEKTNMKSAGQLENT